MRRTFIIIQYVAIAVAVVALFVVLFTIGDTDVGPEAPPPPVTLICAFISALGAAVAGIIQWIGLPPAEEKPEPSSEGPDSN